MGVGVSSSQVLSAAPSSSHTSPAPAWGPSHRRLSSTNCSKTVPFHMLQLFMNCYSVGPFHGVQSFRNSLLQCGSLWGHEPCQQTCSSVGSSLHRSTGPARSLLQHRLSMGSQPPLVIHLLWHGVLPRLQVEICSAVDLHGLQGFFPLLKYIITKVQPLSLISSALASGRCLGAGRH